MGIYLTAFGYALGINGPNSQATTSTSSGEATDLGNQNLMIIAITAVFAIASTIAAVFVATRRRNPKKQEL